MGDLAGAVSLPGVVLSSVVAVPGTSNVRDLGGYPVAQGRVIRQGRLFRAEALAKPGPDTGHVAAWDDAHIDDYRALGLGTVVDLRGEHEVELAPTAWAEPTNASVLRIAIEQGGEGDATDYVRQIGAGDLREFSAADLAAYYAETIRASATVFAVMLTAIADDSAGPVLIHCASGKDRTGMAIALLLEVLGTPRDIVVADYALTGHLRPDRVEAYSEMLDEQRIDHDAVRALFETPPEAMAQLLRGLDEEFGSVTDFVVRAGGLDPAVIPRLVRVLTEPEAQP